jgi:uncharacterized protein YwgA
MAQKIVTMTLSQTDFAALHNVIHDLDVQTKEEQKRSLQKIKNYLIAVETLKSVNVSDWTIEPTEVTEMRIRKVFTGKEIKSTYQFLILAGTPDAPVDLSAE